ncbi:hypothetical protein, partial [Rhodopirellula bahusiensis]|uniref:hypothetical protein n=4 Tax=Rhodopirellula bahusiensis TaxID=2014065 RepID=UPI003263E36E
EEWTGRHRNIFRPFASSPFIIQLFAMSFTKYTAPFAEYPVLQQRVLTVLKQLPEDVQADFLSDERFRVEIDNYVPGVGWSFLMPAPGIDGNGSRCVILRSKLADASEAFAHYVIAHEFAHAFLRNGGWGEITDVEQAADALAASWGFERPA